MDEQTEKALRYVVEWSLEFLDSQGGDWTQVEFTQGNGQKLRVEPGRVRFGRKGEWVDLADLLPNQSDDEGDTHA